MIEWTLIYTLAFPTNVGLGIERHEIKEETYSTQRACKRAKLELEQMYEDGRIELVGSFCDPRIKERT